MSLEQRFTHGRRFRVFGLAFVAALVWTAVVADPALAIHNRSRAFSIVDANRAVPDAPDTFTCRFIENQNGVPVFDYRCRNRDMGFERLLIGPMKSDEPEALLVTGAGANGDQTEMTSPSRFTCNHRGGPSRLPGDFDCEDNNGRDFTLRDFAYAQNMDDPNLIYALPCGPCVASP